MAETKMNVKLLAHTQLTAEFSEMLQDENGIDYSSDGQAVALSAIRTCYSPNKPSEIVAKEGAKYFGSKATDGKGGTEADRLIRMIMRSGHTSTVEHLTFTFAVEGVSRALLAQLTRHRVGFSFSVQSQRYTKYFSEDIKNARAEAAAFQNEAKRHGHCRFTIGEEQMMVEMYLQGNSADEIGEAFGAAKTTVTGILRANGVSMRTNNEAVLNQDYFSEIDSHRKAQYLGFILADGSVGHYKKGDDKVSHQLGIELADVDGYYLESFLADIESRNKVSQTKRGTRSICVVSERLVSDLEKLGVVPQKTDKVSLKDALARVPEDFHGSLLLGYFEGNGHISKSGNANLLDISTGSQQMAEDITELLSNIIPKDDIKVSRQGNCYRVNVYKGESISSTLSFMYKSADIDRVLKRKFLTACEKSEDVNKRRILWLERKAEESQFILPEKIANTLPATFIVSDYLDRLRKDYIRLIMAGIPQEDARAITGQGMKTNLVLTGNLRSLLDFYSKRKAGKGAQKEIADLAERLKDEVIAVEPWVKPFFEGSDA